WFSALSWHNPACVESFVQGAAIQPHNTSSTRRNPLIILTPRCTSKSQSSPSSVGRTHKKKFPCERMSSSLSVHFLFASRSSPAHRSTPPPMRQASRSPHGPAPAKSWDQNQSLPLVAGEFAPPQ